MYKRKDGFVTRCVGNQIMAVPVGKRTNDMKEMVVLTESAELLWEALEQGCEKENLVSLLTERYKIDAETAQRDAEDFLSRLREKNLLV